MYGDELEKSLSYSANTFASSYIENLGDGTFKVTELPNQAQFSSVNDILLKDINNDGNKDIILAGNLYTSEIETPRNDAGYGLFLKGNGKGEFNPVSSSESGLFVEGDTKIMKLVKLGKYDKLGLIFSKNNDYIQLLQVNN